MPRKRNRGVEDSAPATQPTRSEWKVYYRATLRGLAT
jgi:hypothetical protein